MNNTLSSEAFQVLLQRAGLRVKPQQFDELRAAHSLLAAMCDRVRQPRRYDAEPAHVFKPQGR
ncbi:MAG: hypothetical protein ACYC0T_04830 [Ramlibacter sp.]